MAKRTRDFKVEYARRKAKGQAAGLSLSQSRGHPRIGEKHIASGRIKELNDHQIQVALAELGQGKGLGASAKVARMTPDKFRRFLVSRNIGEKHHGRWRIRNDVSREMAIISRGRGFMVMVNNLQGDASLLGQYLDAVGRALDDNNPDFLRPFRGSIITDIHGKKYPLATNLIALYRQNQTDPFEYVYRIVV